MHFLFQIRKLCKVIYRKLDFARYPSHVRNPYTYAFKPIIIHVSILFVFLEVRYWGSVTICNL